MKIGLELVIEKLIPDGKSMGRLDDGRVVILPAAVPGDRVVALDVTERKGLVTAGGFEVLEPSSLRIEPSCPVARECGGCDWMMLSIGEQRRHKLSVLQDALVRIGKINEPRPLSTVVAGKRAEGYRGRVRLQVQDGHIGFFSRRSHHLVEPERCAVITDELNEALTTLRQMVKAQAESLSDVAYVELRQDTAGGVAVYFAHKTSSVGVAEPSLFAELRHHFAVGTSRSEPGLGVAYQRFHVTDETYLLSPPGGFTQVNWEVNRAFVARVVEGAVERGARHFADLYAGCGNFALPLLARGLSGVAVEAVPAAIIAAQVAAREQGLDAEAFVCADAVAHARRLKERSRPFDLVIVDPPRAGVKEGIGAVASLCTGWMAMCSCNPATLARDLRALVAHGLTIQSIEAFDMFPQTHHVETLVWLHRGSVT
jgi:23S rRNA (uracil1939-C5)-methyltransferase